MTATTSFRALGTTALVAVPRRSDLVHARGILSAQLEELDRACSRFRPDSQLSRVNQRAGQPVRVGRLLGDAVEAAVAAARDTCGLVDPTLGANLRAAGYDRTFELVQARDSWTLQPVVHTRRAWARVELDRNASVIRIPFGCQLDLGATAKALAADRAARTIAKALESSVLVSLGGDIAVAGEGEWPIRIAERHDAPLDGDGPRIALVYGGLATSTTTVRRWRTDHGNAHHLIDPRTGRPARTCWRTVSVAASSCLDANIAATAAMLLGENAIEWLRARNLASRLVANDGGVIHVGGWPAEAEAA
ncbi:MAG TPA: FAD:protein FMN transferase [Gaiellaceae bacterium]|nr:FAD:protein FMN transferase [Gaiellaceae bacterium]